MHLQTVLVLPCLVAGALAETYQIKGSLSEFKANSSVESTNVTARVYEGCKELDKDGKTVVSDGSVCVSRLLELTLLALTAVPGEQEGIVLAKNSTILEAQPSVEMSSVTATTVTTDPSKSSPAEAYRTSVNSKREDGDRSETLLKRMNDRLSQQAQGKHTVRAVQIGQSEIHPRDGIAVRTNLYSDDTVLHVHTNGSHATAAFMESAASQVDRRDEVSTQNHKYTFSSGVKGMKMQLQWADKKQGCDVSSSDLKIFASAFGFGDGKNEPALKKSDSWKYAVCENKDNTKLFHGKLISEEYDSDLGYEGGDDSMDCK